MKNKSLTIIILFLSIILNIAFCIHIYYEYKENRNKKEFEIKYTISNQENDLHKNGYINFKETAECIAKAVGYEYYGKNVMNYKYEVQLIGDSIWRIYAYPISNFPIECGSMYIHLSKKDGRITYIIHDK